MVQQLRKLAPKCGYKTHNELAVALIEIGLALSENPHAPSLPPELLQLRAKLHGESPAAASPELRELVAQLVQEQLAARDAAPSKDKDRRKPAA